MMDWDMPRLSCPDASLTVRRLGDVEEFVRDCAREHSSSIVQLYAIPGCFGLGSLEKPTPLDHIRRALNS